MNCRVAPGAPARALSQKRSVIRVTDVDLLASHAHSLNLGVALQAKIRIIFDQHLPVD
jgi:hypothetical protein